MKIKSILIAAIGGQGGNILAEWIFTAASLAGHQAQSVGLPGLAQRGGATSQYIEIAIAEKPESLDQAIFCQFPVPGQVDILLSQELLEMGRMLQRGYSSPQATIVTSTHRDYTILEKMPMGRAIVDPAELEEAGRKLSAQFVAVDVPRLIREHRLAELSGNAVLLGALAGTGALPILAEHYAQAIRQAGVAPEINLEAFEVGLSHVRLGGHEAAQRALAAEPDPVERRAALLPARFRARYRQLAAPLMERYGETLGRSLVEAVYQMADYQDLGYAEDYLARVDAMYQTDQEIAPERKDRTLTYIYARNLAALMTFEDAVRVAEFKTRQGRFDRIKKQLDVQPGQVYEVVDYLKPDAEEIYGIFPWQIVDPLLPILDRLNVTQDSAGKPRYWEQKPRTTTLAGYLKLKFLTWFKPLRPVSWRFRKERAFLQEYERFVRRFTEVDYELACLVASTGQMVRGYGNIRRRTFDAVCHLMDGVLLPLVEQERQAGLGYRLTRQVGEVALKTLLADEHGIRLAETLVQRVLERYGTIPYDALIAEVIKAGETLGRPLALTMREDALP